MKSEAWPLADSVAAHRLSVAGISRALCGKLTLLSLPPGPTASSQTFLLRSSLVSVLFWL